MSLDELLSHSASLDGELVEFFKLEPQHNTDRLVVCQIMCGIVFEHSESIKILIATGDFNSAFGLVRSQYKVLVRPLILLFSETDTAIAKFKERKKRVKP